MLEQHPFISLVEPDAFHEVSNSLHGGKRAGKAFKQATLDYMVTRRQCPLQSAKLEVQDIQVQELLRMGSSRHSARGRALQLAAATSAISVCKNM